MLLKTTLVQNIFTINHSLGNITRGQLDERVKVQDYQEFAILSDGINSTVEALKKAIADAAARIDAELEFARAIQTASLPAVFPPWPDLHDFDIYASMHTAKEVGGDFYDFFLVGDKLAFVMADVSGKGIPAALFMMTARTQIKNHILSEPDLATAFNKVNDALCENNEENMFVTVFAGLLDYKTGVLEFINAGHNKPLLRHGGSYTWLKEISGMPMGYMEGQHYKLKTTQLEPGDMIYTYTDGVTEAVNENKELYSDPRLLEFVNSHPTEDVKELLESVLADVKQFAGTAEQADDITMLAVRKN
jgi:serine phosphatase RsbU (regulator of sigma subunit)